MSAILFPFDERFRSEESANCGERIVFHYTSAAGALGILNSDQLWLTMAYHMNDSQELRHAHAIARSVAFLMLKGADELFRTKFLAEFDHQLRQIHQVHVYAACFSEAPDLLSQWRGYASGGGYNLGFSLEALEHVAKKESLIISEVLYGFDDQRKLLEPILAPLLQQYDRELSPENNREELNELFRPAVRLIAQESARIKHETFSEEREWRIFSPPFTGAQAKEDFIIRNNRIVPVLKIDLLTGHTPNAMHLKDICIRSFRTGPGPDITERHNALGSVFQKNRIYWRVARPSNAPLR